MPENTLTPRSSFPTGSRQNLRVYGCWQTSSLIILFVFHFASHVFADENFSAINPDIDCTGPNEHPVCAIKTFVECSRGPLDVVCENVGLVYDDKTRSFFKSREDWAREQPWTLTFAEAHGEGYDYTFFGRRNVTLKRFNSATHLPESFSQLTNDMENIIEVRVEGCGIATAECSNDAWSYFLQDGGDDSDQEKWRVIGESRWLSDQAARTCVQGDDPFFDTTYCGHHIHGLPP